MALTTPQEALRYCGKFNKKVVKYREDQMIDRWGQLEKTGEAP